jgi:predicted Zn-dependent protease
MVAAVTVAALLLFSAPAWAVSYNLENCQFNASGNSLLWKDATTRSGYATPAAGAVAAWNSSTTHLTLTLTTTGANVQVQDGNFGPTINGHTWDGVTYQTCSGGYNTVTAQSWINRYYADGYGTNERQSVLVHEIGHALGLDHFDTQTCSQVQVMESLTGHRYVDCNKYIPQFGDIAGINAMY